MDAQTDLMVTMETELKRGTLTLAVLSLLKTPQYGYSLLEELAHAHIEIEAGTLYPLLRRLESQGLLDSTWNTEESRPRKFYQLNKNGHAMYRHLSTKWRETSSHLATLIGESHDKYH